MPTGKGLFHFTVTSNQTLSMSSIWTNTKKHDGFPSTVYLTITDRISHTESNSFFPATIRLFKINDGNTKTIHQICPKLTIKIQSLLLPLNRLHILFCCFHCWLWTSKYRLIESWWQFIITMLLLPNCQICVTEIP